MMAKEDVQIAVFPELFAFNQQNELLAGLVECRVDDPGIFRKPFSRDARRDWISEEIDQ